MATVSSFLLQATMTTAVFGAIAVAIGLPLKTQLYMKMVIPIGITITKSLRTGVITTLEAVVDYLCVLSSNLQISQNAFALSKI